MKKNILLWLSVLFFLGIVFSNNLSIAPQSNSLNYSDFIKQVNQGSVSSVTISGYTITGTLENGDEFSTTRPAAEDSQLMDDLFRNNVEVIGEAPQRQGVLRQLFIASFPVLLLFGILYFAMRGMQNLGGGRNNPISFGKSRAKALNREDITTRFSDVAGVEEAKEEVSELVDFLKDPRKFTKIGARIPRGILMCGPPGTGKTLLARAIAGEAGVPFFSISGSDFVEMFVGVGASRVRDMFTEAKKSSPCIIFIDEIDAVGRHRGAGLGGGHDEREQTLNQLLVEMDGFEKNSGTIVIAATNRPDVLDPALLRPGRFDRQVFIHLPDLAGREKILKVHMKQVPHVSPDDAMTIARGTPGFTGADLANLVNEAALLAAKTNRKKVGILEFEKAKDKLMMGSERRSMVMNDKDKALTAYHEAGHAIVGLTVPEHDPVYKVTIIPRGRALGVTMFLPEEDKYSQSKLMLTSQLCSLFGGRVAEELVYGREYITTGASNDIERATGIARAMVTKWGLSEKLGPQKFDGTEDEVFLGRQLNNNNKTQTSEETAKLIDQEVKKLLSDAYSKSKTILKKNMSKLKLMAECLIKYETIGEEQIKAIMKGKAPNPPEEWIRYQKDEKSRAKKVASKSRSKPRGGKALNPAQPLAKNIQSDKK
ncbi:MAG: ATP-dependent metallopeptidase FtsH/Yme1/Tma family protein [Candidatus Portiera sp.]|nr:ATP-dependent metallopeptidase FtsH/Yme1/Tma family protein [Portiera sp.]